MPARSERGATEILQPASARQIRRILVSWGKNHYQDFPWRRARRPWHALLAEVLLQRTRARSVVPVYLELTQQYPTPAELAAVPVARIRKLIYPLGLAWRAPLIKRLGKELATLGGRPPRTIKGLVALPGVGPYAAAAWLGFHGHSRAVIIDANVVRLLCRITGRPMDGETRRKRWLFETADLLTPQRGWKEYNYALLDFTMQVCIKNPLCSVCPIGPKLCKFGRARLAR